MSNPSRRKGTGFEVDLLKFGRGLGLEIERLALHGSADEGDLILKLGGLPFVLEAKATKAFTPAEWIKQAKVEAANYATHRGVEVPHFAVVAKARQRPVSEAYVITTLAEWLRQIDG